MEGHWKQFTVSNLSNYATTIGYMNTGNKRAEEVQLFISEEGFLHLNLEILIKQNGESMNKEVKELGGQKSDK